ncbi:hypothetical protein HGRIS_008121 [Hohenbuehelia grisea]|uniref:Ceramide glucosyltransferase n=1 Tax=Hohenbuehelia grisea TaxID=104357 RepID=A0ABR3J717_9AGAR
MDSGTILLAFSLLGIVWYTALWAIGLMGCLTARKRYRLRPRSPSASAPRETVPGVSILRPLKGLDPNLYENLESTFTQEYPNFEILLSVADENDQALPVVRELMVRYPSVDAKIIIGEENVGVNPKVNNLVRSYRAAANDILWVLDSNVMVDRGTLARSVDVLVGSPSSSTQSKRIGLVHHAFYASANTLALGAQIEEAFLNTNHAKMYVAINTAAVDSCVVGKSNMYRRSDVERVNGSLKPLSGRKDDSTSEPCGLPAFGRFLAEDNMIAGALWHELGLRHDLSCDVVQNVVGDMTVMDYVKRRVRWIRVRKHMVLAATLAEPFTESIVLSAIAASSAKYLFGFPPLLLLPVHFALWLYVDMDVYASLVGYPMPTAKRFQFIFAWAAREMLALPIYLFAILGDEVEWRGRKYQVLRNGEVKRSSGTGWFDRLRWPGSRVDLNQYERLGVDVESS